MGLAPETAVAPLQQAPPDRPTVQLEQVCNQLLAIVLADRVIDMNERAILFRTMKQLSDAAQMGGIGNGAPTSGATAQPPMSPADMNQNTEPLGTMDGAEPMDDQQGY